MNHPKIECTYDPRSSKTGISLTNIIYQVMEKEPRENTTGDFIEFNIGVLAKLLFS